MGGPSAIKKILCISYLIFFQLFVNAQTGLIMKQPGSQDGYVLFAPLSSKNTYLIDKNGKQIHIWKSSRPPGQSVYLLENGLLLRAAKDTATVFVSGGGFIEMLNWNSVVTWSYSINTKNESQHHDICPLPNGNILVLVWEKKSREEAIKAGRNPQLLGESLWSEKVIELKPVGKDSAKIVWEWHVWDHLIQDFDEKQNNYGIVANNPQKINVNYLASTDEDWLHFNSIDYNKALDQIMISNRNFCEFFIIDHSTTSAQAATRSGGRYNHGGRLLYRWGNPQAYNIGAEPEKKLYRQHHAQWIKRGLFDAGNIMVFNNGLERPGGNYSSLEIIKPPIDETGSYLWMPGQAYGPDTSYWKYTHQDFFPFYSKNVSSGQRLANGNTLICEGEHGRFFEIDGKKNKVWEYVNPIGAETLSNGQKLFLNQVFRCVLYRPNYPGLKKNLFKGIEIVVNPTDHPPKEKRKG
jgi:hypothetical protein